MAEQEQAQSNESVHPSTSSGQTEDGVEGETPEQTVAALEEQIAQLTQSLAGRDASIQKLASDLKEREGALGRLQRQVASAVAKYREALLASAPDIPQDMVTGQSIEEVDASVAKARQIVAHVRSQLETQTASTRVPSGAPLRSAPDLSVLSASAKIAYGLGRNER